MTVRGVRGATTADNNTAGAILCATETLLEAMIAANQIASPNIAAAYFTTTADLNAAFPATAARRIGWQHVPLLDAQEIPVPDSLPRCIRILLLWNSDVPQDKVVHIYQGDARQLRPDLIQQNQTPEED